MYSVAAESKSHILLSLVSAIAALALLCGLSLSLPVLAQTQPASLKNVVLTVYPEYDDPIGLGVPTVLVMLDGQIEGAVPPTTVRFLVPQGATMYSAGSGPRASYVGGPPDRKPSDISGWDEISYELRTDNFVVEYYMPIQSSPDKAFSVEFVPLYDISRLTAIVQEPRQATNFSSAPQMQPGTQRQSTDTQGFNLHYYTYATLKSGQPVGFSISYTKKNPAPSLEISSSNQGPVLAAVILGVVLLGAGVYWALRKSSPVRPRRDRVSRKGHGPEPGGDRFCTRCGAKLDKSHRYCRKCGNRGR